MRFWAAPLIISLALAMFIACGDETTSVTETPAMSVVESGKKMVVCSDDNAGDIVYVKDSSAVFYCADGEWQTLNGKDGADGKEGAQGKDGSSVKDTVVIRDTIFVTERDTVLLLSYDTLVVINRDTVYVQEPASSNSDISSSSQITEVPEGYMRDSRDGRLYKTVQIGNQIWMAENMKLDVNDAYCYNDVKENCEKYGMLYTATTAKRVCPDGWQLPVWDDWYTLLYNISDFFNVFVLGSNITFKDEATISTLRSAIGWNGENGNDSLGFSAFPVGVLENGVYADSGNVACYMSQFQGDIASFCLNNNSLKAKSSANGSVRCLKALSLEDAYGKCNNANDGMMSKDSRYICINSNWRKPSLLEKEIGTCSSKNEGEVKEGYTCMSGVWYGSLTDSRDGKTYRTVMIGYHTWMAENLNYEVDNSFCYDGLSTNCSKYGRLYGTPVGSRICPDGGWRLPNTSDWWDLFSFVGGESVAGVMLKSTTGWEGDNNGIDLYGFSVLPSGFLNETYFSIGYEAGFMTDSRYVIVFSTSEEGFRFLDGAASIRCIRDEETADSED